MSPVRIPAPPVCIVQWSNATPTTVYGGSAVPLPIALSCACKPEPHRSFLVCHRNSRLGKPGANRNEARSHGQKGTNTHELAPRNTARKVSQVALAPINAIRTRGLQTKEPGATVAEDETGCPLPTLEIKKAKQLRCTPYSTAL
jgi:hypothetical protein